MTYTSGISLFQKFFNSGKDRALARNCMGEMVASELVNMRDGAASAYEVAS